MAESPDNFRCEEVMQRNITMTTSDKKLIKTIAEGLKIVNERIDNVIEKDVAPQIKMLTKKFICNIIQYFSNENEDGKISDDFLINLMLNLQLYTKGSLRPDGDFEYFTNIVRAPNPTDEKSGQVFSIGRECEVGQEAPHAPEHLSDGEKDARNLTFEIKRKIRNFFRIPREDFFELIPEEILNDERLEKAFLEALFSNGAYETYQLSKENCIQKAVA